jgi:hypothetical protein
MVARPGFLGGLHQGDSAERDDRSGFGSSVPADHYPVVRLGSPIADRATGGFGGQPGFDPVWGSLGAPSPQGHDDWLSRQDSSEGVELGVEIFGNGFQISGQIRTGQFDRLSDWINMQTGFMQVRDASLSHLGLPEGPGQEQRKGTLWVRLDQVIMLAERSPIQQSRPGAPVIRKQQLRVSIVTPGYTLHGRIHVHAHGSMAQFLETPDPHFLPITDLTVRWLSDPALVARFPFALVNRQQLVTILGEPTADSARSDNEAGADDSPLNVRWGAA